MQQHNSRVHGPSLAIKYIGHAAHGYGRSGHVTAAAATRNRYYRALVFRRQSLRRGRRIKTLFIAASVF